MLRRFALACAALVLTAAAPHRSAHVAAAPVALPDTVRVAIKTTLGTIELNLDHKHAPKTVENFVHYVDTRRFDGMHFYRAMHLAWGEQPNGLIQAGLSGINVFPPVVHEPTSQTGLHHKAGAVSMARGAPGTATADFSIMLSELTGLDADPKGATPDAQAGFAVFGEVASGMEVVRAIWDQPRSPTKGVGVMKGQMLDPAVKVISVRRVALPAPAPALQPPAPVLPTPAPTQSPANSF